MEMEELLKLIAKGFGYDLNDVREGYLKSEDKSIDSVLAYCKEKVNGKEKEANKQE